MPEDTVKPENIIPLDSELGQLLLQLSDDGDDIVWKIANITNELIEELEGGIVTRKTIYQAVARCCKGKKFNTIRKWAEVASDFDIDVQEKYKHLLSFEHFRVARQLHVAKLTPTLEYGLKWCVEGNDQKLNAGKFHTVGEMLNHFMPEYRETGAVVSWSRVKEDLYDKFLLVDNDTDRERLLEAWKTIDYVLEKKV